MSTRSDDWDCAVCGNNNYASRTHCNMRKCGAPRGDLEYKAHSGSKRSFEGDRRGYGYHPVDGDFIRKRARTGNQFLDTFPPPHPHELEPVYRHGAPFDQRVPMSHHLPLDTRAYSPVYMNEPAHRGMDRGLLHMNGGPGYSPMGGMMGGMRGNVRPMMSQPQGRDASWTCPSCGNSNYASRTVCNLRRCGAPRPASAEPGWTCNKCQNYNYAHRTSCNMRKCGATKEESDNIAKEEQEKKNRALDEIEGVWRCTQCGNRNYSSRFVCNMRKCRAPKPDAESTASTGEQSQAPSAPY